MRKVDYSLYLVTGRDLLPPGKDYYESLEQAIIGGVTIVQVREKNIETLELLEIAKKTKEICHKHGIPIIINDRIDIALAMGADGVHLGQNDMPPEVARQLLPDGTIIGVSVSTVEEAKKVASDNIANYVGIAAVWPTNSKQVKTHPLRPRGVGPILDALAPTNINSVAIGGINADNALRTLHGAWGTKNIGLDGIAVISAIVSSQDPKTAASQLREIISAEKQSRSQVFQTSLSYTSTAGILSSVSVLLEALKNTTPLVHQITNNVTVNQLANATIALGGSPIMATAMKEMQDLSKIASSLLVNMGTVDDHNSMLLAGRCANNYRKPVVFDPVGIGATSFRKDVANELLGHWQATVIKGNAGEVGALAKSTEVTSRGVDSGQGGFSDPANVVRTLARRERCIVAMTGEIDYVSDGHIVVKSTNGHALLGSITGSGCMVGATVATFCGAASIDWARSNKEKRLGQMYDGDMLQATLGGILAITIASEIAALRSDVKGPATFVAALIDELYNLKPQTIIDRAKIEIV